MSKRVIKEETIKCVGRTKYLGTIVSRNGKSSEDFKRRIDIVRATTNTYETHWFQTSNKI